MMYTRMLRVEKTLTSNAGHIKVDVFANIKFKFKRECA